MNTMNIESINEHTLSEGIGTPNCVYKVIEDCTAKSYKHVVKVDLKVGDLICITGCGALNNSGKSKFFIKGIWMKVPNKCVEHFANPIRVRAKDQMPF